MTAGTSQPTASVPPWNPHKQAAPTPPTGQESLPSNPQTPRAATSGANYPDVTAGTRDLYEVERRTGTERDDRDDNVSVLPDYPLDSLPRNATARPVVEGSTATDHSGRGVTSDPRVSDPRTSDLRMSGGRGSDPRPSQGRSSQGSSGARTSQSSAGRPAPSTGAASRTRHSSGGARNSGSSRPTGQPSGGRPSQHGSGTSAPSSSVVPSSTSMPPPPHSARPPGEIPPPHGARSSRAVTQQPVSHSNVSVSVNHPHSGADPRLRTQDLSVGVSSRLEHRSHHSGNTNNMLPDLVAHSQPQNSSNRPPTNLPRTPLPGPPGTVPDPRYSQGHRHHDGSRQRPSRHHRDQRYSRSHRRSRRRSQSEDDAKCKDSCMKCVAVSMSFRWILVVLSLLGVCCVIAGIILAALHAAGKSFLFLAIMFIGLGVLLVVVVGVGWKCTPRGHEPLHALFHIGEFRRPRSRRSRGHHRRDGRWHGGTMYPEFQYPRPPPTYDASMRDYQAQQQQLALSQTTPGDIYDADGDSPVEDYSLPSSPPPSYRSRASTVRAGIQITFPPNQGGDFPDSRPPTYRSHPSNTLPGHGRTRPSLSRDDDDDDAVDQAPADVAFTGSSVVVDTNSNQMTSIQIDSAGVPNQNVTVSVTTVSVTTQSGQPVTAGNLVSQGPQVGVYTVTDVPSVAPEDVALSNTPTDAPSEATSDAQAVFPADAPVVDAVGDFDGDRINTAL